MGKSGLHRAKQIRLATLAAEKAAAKAEKEKKKKKGKGKKKRARPGKEQDTWVQCEKCDSWEKLGAGVDPPAGSWFCDDCRK